MNIAKALLVCVCVTLRLTEARHVRMPDTSGEDPVPSNFATNTPKNLTPPPPEVVPPLIYDGSRKTVEEYMETAHEKYLNMMLGATSSKRNTRELGADERLAQEMDESAGSPRTLEDWQERKDYVISELGADHRLASEVHDAEDSPGTFEDWQGRKDYVIPKGPCLFNIPDFLCTVQLVPGGTRHIVSRKEIEENLQEADENYQGLALPFCCGGRASKMVIE